QAMFVDLVGSHDQRRNPAFLNDCGEILAGSEDRDSIQRPTLQPWIIIQKPKRAQPQFFILEKLSEYELAPAPRPINDRSSHDHPTSLAHVIQNAITAARSDEQGT